MSGIAERTAHSRTKIDERMRAAITLTLALFMGCSVKDRVTSLENDVPYACRSSADCNNVGVCQTDFGICALESGEITTVLFEVTPRASEPVYGGARYVVQMDLAMASANIERGNDDGVNDRGIKDGWLELNVPPRVPVSGSIKADAQGSCVSRIARSTLPATLVFTPRQRLFGLAAQSYEMTTRYDVDIEEFVFQGSLPPGDYDVYMRPITEDLASDCRATPQLFRNQSLVSCTQAEGCRQEPFVLQQQAPRSLRLTIPWRPDLEGWLVDMVHPVTAEVISNRVRLTAADATGNEIVASLNYSSAQPGVDYILEGDEIVRLMPPDDTIAGTVLLQRSGLELLTPGEGAVGDVFTFGTPVDYQAWVWKEGESESPVAGVVSFAALDLDEVEEGVFVSFSASAEIDEQGQVSAKLLPGRYRIRVNPPTRDDPTLGLFAGFEWTGTVWPPTNGGPTTQAGHVIPVPAAVTLEGTVVAERGDQPLRGVEVRASASNIVGDPCTSAPPVAPENIVPCPRGRVLREALALDPYVPRTRSGLTGGNGTFAIDGLDCGRCQVDAGAAFELSARPASQTGLAWSLRTGVQLDSSALMEPLEMPTPVAFPIQLTYANPAPEEENPAADAEDDRVEARALPGALVRVFALIDNDSQVINDDDGLPPCVTIPNPDGSRCIQSLLQLAEVRSDSDGEFLLLLPPRIE